MLEGTHEGGKQVIPQFVWLAKKKQKNKIKNKKSPLLKKEF